MQRTIETRTIRLATDALRSVEGRVRVEGVDARAGGRGVLFERHRPVSVVVREAGSERELAIGEPAWGARPWLLLAAPAAALFVRAVVRERRSKRSKGR